MNKEFDSESSRIANENARLQTHIRTVNQERERTNTTTKKLEQDLHEQVREMDK